MRFVYVVSTLLAATSAVASAIPAAADGAEVVPIDDAPELDAPNPTALVGEEDNTELDIEDPNGNSLNILLFGSVPNYLEDFEEADDVILEKRGIFDSGANVCKKKGMKNCYHVKSNGRCKNLVSKNGKPFVSGRGDGGSLCTVYSQKGCPWIAGKRFGFDERGGNFGFSAKSLKCSVKV
ncbi:hypothetical protein EYZ11_004211 [Aspergillus tanneri]|uniref:Uncharacterized protein n=1 Tax=Aspergillus tanneri TaxID=1220188 RepID=A0A4S3JL62_9EURO|nr:uncharacterized protein ATNIH1004_003877 [Aspergillus tanneri]KAA8647994.1 hypothetical protein ATNIH1004_003877 [Aspergillus tanneri]THC96306.1 hypothetical protein EYZ11_004211 [Aspergillus tanneri]